MTSQALLVRRLRPDAHIPRRTYATDAAFDLSTPSQVVLAPLERQHVRLGIAVAVPAGHAGLIVPRSGLAQRYGLSVVNSPGLIDEGYRGELGVLLLNLGQETVLLEPGERIAQLAIVPIFIGPVLQVDDLTSTTRGTRGFGSTDDGISRPI
jgi:dUTP pyrophosphatase